MTALNNPADFALPKPNFPVDLHAHTNRSDGSDTPAELITRAAACGMKIIAITDHDIVPPETVTEDGVTCSLAEYAAKKGIHVIPGIEISCDTDVEDVHIVCFGCDFHAPFFHDLEDMVIRSKTDGYRELVEALNQAGMPLTWDEILTRDGKRIPESAVQKKMIFEAMAAKGYTKDWGEAKLLVQKTPAFHIKRKKPDPIMVLREVKAAGGFAILAHPYLITEPVSHDGKEITRREYIDLLIEAGLSGIEACYTYDKTSYAGTMTKEEIEKEVLAVYSDRLFISGGSDYHADFKKGVKNFRSVGECGITQEHFDSIPLLAGLL